ncbi:hypothetical protein SLS58_011179 [Diplodia intermedia]|uniref:Uncharacterized protein n=1 Tax=Diplodia intermedia TaxID=856260 RepID=A0ABR3T0Z6_9PEZI
MQFSILILAFPFLALAQRPPDTRSSFEPEHVMFGFWTAGAKNCSGVPNEVILASLDESCQTTKEPFHGFKGLTVNPWTFAETWATDNCSGVLRTDRFERRIFFDWKDKCEGGFDQMRQSFRIYRP